MDMENDLPVADASGWNLPLCSHLNAAHGSIQVNVNARLQRCISSRGISRQARMFVEMGQVFKSDIPVVQARLSTSCIKILGQRSSCRCRSCVDEQNVEAS